MSQPTTVHVSGISPATTDKEVQDFFSFWYDAVITTILRLAANEPLNLCSGKITFISVTPVSSESDSLKSATVTFEKEA